MEAQGVALLPFQPVVQGVDVAAAPQSLDAYLANIADGEVAVQGLAEGQGRVAEVACLKFEVQLLVEADAQLQLGGMWPFRLRLLDTVEDEFEDRSEERRGGKEGRSRWAP